MEVFCNFNSIKVRLKQPSALPLASLIVNFNSIKVRLKQIERNPRLRKSQFQFHKGTIKTGGCPRPPSLRPISIP